jgi:hypothetical protein
MSAASIFVQHPLMSSPRFNAGAGSRAQQFHPQIIEEDIRTNKWAVVSQPGFHRSRTVICISATRSRSASTSDSRRDFDGVCHLRFDDTNPVKEDQEYVDSIMDAGALARLSLGHRP